MPMLGHRPDRHPVETSGANRQICSDLAAFRPTYCSTVMRERRPRARLS